MQLNDLVLFMSTVDLEKATFVDTPWSNPEADLSPEAYCSVCLIDENTDTPKVKSLCKLPVRSTPGGPVNKAALRNASARLNQTQCSAESKAKAKAKLASLMSSAGIDSQLVEKAYPTEHAARQSAPGSFKSIRSKELAPGVRALIGFGEGDQGSKIQSIRFDASKFTPEQAKKWLVDHDFSTGKFEEASGEVAKLGPTVNDVHVPGAMDDLEECTDEELLAALGLIGPDSLYIGEEDDPLDKACKRKVKKQDLEFLITKASAEQRIAYAIVYSPDTVDTQGDFASAAEIEKMAHNFMVNSRAYDLQHTVDVPAGRASVVESYIAPVDITLDTGKLIRKGSWVVATYFDDTQLWNLVKAGAINAYSIFGKGKRTPIS